MMLIWFRSGILGPVLVLAMTSGAAAQPATPSSLERLKVVVPAHSKVTVTDTQGQEFRGTMDDVSESGLSLTIDGAIRRFEATDVRSVRVRTHDSLVNGALIGAAVSGGLSSLMFLDNECHTDPVCYQAVAVYAGLGAAVGLGIDVLIHGHAVVYTGRPRVQNRLVVAPIVARGGKGVRLTFSF